MNQLMYRVPQMEKEWKQICNYIPEVKEHYWISNFGEVFSTSKYMNRNMKQQSNIYGYLIIKLSLKNGKERNYFVHRIMMMCFEPIENSRLYDVNHLIGIKTINELQILEWCTRAENIRHAYKMGLKPLSMGETAIGATIDNKQAELICQGLEKRMQYEDISEQLLHIPYTKQLMGVITRIKTGQDWKHISCKYNFEETHRSNQMFTDNEAKSICNYCSMGIKSSEEILTRMGYDLSLYTDKQKESMYNLISKIRRGVRYKHIPR